MTPAPGRIVRVLSIVGVLGLGLCLVRYWLAPAAFLRGYLPASLFWVCIPVGSLALLMIHQLTGGAWGARIRPTLQAAAATLPLNALQFLPLGFGLEGIYPWVRPDPALAETVARKSAYLNAAAFNLREAVVFLVWIGLAAALGVWRGTTAKGNRSRRSSVGLILYGLTAAIFGIDWIMSLEPRWSSTNFGFMMMVGPMVGALAFAILAVCAWPQHPEGPEQDAVPVLNDLGNLLLAGVLLWSYLEFQQYLAIWYENLPDKVVWYLHRNRNGWEWVTIATALCYGALPFFFLLWRSVKRSYRALRAVAGLVLLGNLIDMYWLTLPAHYAYPGGFPWPDMVSFLATGALWLSAFIWLLSRRSTTGGSHP